VSNQRKFLDWALQQLPSEHSQRDLTLWYSASTRQLKKLGCTGLLSRYGDSLSTLLKTVYPEHSFHDWKFQAVPFKYWQDSRNGRAFLTAFAESRGRDAKDMSFWYSVSAAMIVEAGGRGLLASKGQSPSSAIMSSFPEYSWQPWMFDMVPVGWWKDGQNQRTYIQEGLIPYLLSRGASHSGVRLETLYHATSPDFYKSRGSGLLLLYGSSVPAVARGVYPEHVWDENFAQVGDLEIAAQNDKTTSRSTF
jgi:hypothetical protein